MSDPVFTTRPRTTRTRGVAAARNIVTTGCGRVYVFPPDLPVLKREAGLHHYEYRVGYVERDNDLWVPRDFGNHRLGFGTRSRARAIRMVVENAGWTVLPSSHEDALIPLRIPVQHGDFRAEVVLDFEGLVHVAERVQQTGFRVVETLGAVWPSGSRVVALRDNAESRDRTLHYSRTDAIHALISDSAYVRVPR